MKMVKKGKVVLVSIFMCFAMIALSYAGVPVFAFQLQAKEFTGQVIIFPFYDVRNGTTGQYFSITNTSEKNWVQGHIRFRSGKYSVEVLDFDVILSPNDVFTFWILDDVDGNGNPGFLSVDGDTLKNSKAFLGSYYDSATGSASIPFMISRLEAVGVSSDDALEQAKYGYVEFIPEGAVEDKFMDANGDDVADYSSLLAAVIADYKDNSIDHAWYPDNVFMGHEWFVDFTTLAGYAINAQPIQDFRSDKNDVARLDNGYQPSSNNKNIKSGMNGLILHEEIGTNPNEGNPFYRPDWTTTYGPTLAFGDAVQAVDDSGNGLTRNNMPIPTAWGSIAEVEFMGKNYVENGIPWMARWMDFSGTINTYAILTFPTKYFHFFTDLLFDPTNNTTYTHGAGKNRIQDADYKVNVNKANFDIDYELMAYDTQENTYTPGGTISPLRGGERKVLKDEVNYVSVGKDKDMDTHFDTEGWIAVSNFNLPGGKTLDEDDNTTFIPPTGFVVQEISGYGQFSEDWVFKCPWDNVVGGE